MDKRRIELLAQFVAAMVSTIMNLPFLKENIMRITRVFVSVLPRITAIALVLFAAGNLNLTHAARPGSTLHRLPALHDEAGPVHRPLAIVGVTAGQTARISLVNSPDPNSSDPPTPITVEMCFHDTNGDLILDRSRRPVQKTATLDPHHGEFLDLNGNLQPSPALAS
jgi:hypothetical protein